MSERELIVRVRAITRYARKVREECEKLDRAMEGVADAREILEIRRKIAWYRSLLNSHVNKKMWYIADTNVKVILITKQVGYTRYSSIQPSPSPNSLITESSSS